MILYDNQTLLLQKKEIPTLLGLFSLGYRNVLSTEESNIFTELKNKILVKESQLCSDPDITNLETSYISFKTPYANQLYEIWSR
jgi:hypothetical protein